MYNKKKILNSFIDFVKDNTIFIFLSYLLILLVINIFFGKLYLAKRPGLFDEQGFLILSNISNGFGDIIRVLKNSETPYLLWLGDIKLYSARGLFLPYYLILVDKLALNNFYAILIIKNISFGIIVFLLLKNFYKKYNNFFLIISLFLIYYLPHNNLNSLGIENEEGWLNYFIIILFFLLVSNLKYKSFYLSIILSLIFFLKASMFFLTLIIPIIYIILEKNDKYKYFPLIFIIISNLIWGSYIFNVAGYFAFGSKSSSMSASNLYMISTKDFNKSYPNITPDIYFYRVKEKIFIENIKTEKDFVDILVRDSIKFIKSDPINFLKAVSKKIYVLTLNPYKDSQIPNKINDSLDIKKFDLNIKKSIRFSNIINKIVFDISLIVLFYQLFYKKNKKELINKINLYYFFILSFYLFPYMIGWLYDRHATAIYILSHLYLLIIFTYKKLFFYKN